MVVILHNFQVYKQSNICRLNSTYKSYYFEEYPETKDPLLSGFHFAITRPEWQITNFRNLSLFAFTQRTLVDLR